MTKASNLSLWNKVNVTSPEYTKQANNGRYKFTCVDPMWQTIPAGLHEHIDGLRTTCPKPELPLRRQY